MMSKSIVSAFLILAVALIFMGFGYSIMKEHANEDLEETVYDLSMAFDSDEGWEGLRINEQVNVACNLTTSWVPERPDIVTRTVWFFFIPIYTESEVWTSVLD